MPIEFACHGCHKVLRVADSAAGKKARCPDCETISDVPFTSTPPTPNSDFAGFSPPAPEDEAAPWSTGNWSSSPPPPRTPAGDAGADNPFSAPASGFDSVRTMDVEEIRSKVAGPAICLMVTGGLTAVGMLIYMLIFMFAMVAGPMAGPNGGQDPVESILGTVFAVGFLMFPLARAGLLMYGAWQMKNLQRYPFAMTAAILAVVPLCGCWLLELPFGIWALIVINNPQVKQAFYDAR